MESDAKKEMGRRIKEKREENKLSQDKLASLLGMKRTNIANYEAGRVIPPGNIIKQLADTLNTTSDYLLGRSEFDTSEEDLKKIREQTKGWLKVDTSDLNPDEIKSLTDELTDFMVTRRKTLLKEKERRKE